jgi:hypothetical protein
MKEGGAANQKRKKLQGAVKGAEERPRGQQNEEKRRRMRSQQVKTARGSFGKSTKMKGKRPNCHWVQFLCSPIKAQAQIKAQLHKLNPNWAPKYSKPTLYMHPPHPNVQSIL